MRKMNKLLFEMYKNLKEGDPSEALIATKMKISDRALLSLSMRDNKNVQHSSCSFSPSCVHMRPLGNSNVQMCTP
jgi:hypothetical protein